MTPEEAMKMMRDALQQQLAANMQRALTEAQAQAKQRRKEALIKTATGLGAFAILGVLDAQGAKQRLKRMAEQAADDLAEQCFPGESQPRALPTLPMFGKIKEADFDIIEEES